MGPRSHAGVWNALIPLAEQGLVDRAEVGAAAIYMLNRQHLAAPAVAILAELLCRIRAAFATWDLAPVHASLFGSAARGDGDTRSDIDLFVVHSAGNA